MHDLLEAYARKRRSAAGDPAGQPHPVTRRLLQTEVRQVYAAKLAPKAPGGLSGWLGLSWPRLLVGSAAFALVAVTTTLVLRQESQPNRALKREESASAPVLRAPAGPEGDRQAKRDGDGPRPGEPAKPALVTASDAGLAPAVAKETQSREALESLRLREDKAAPARTKNEEEVAQNNYICVCTHTFDVVEPIFFYRIYWEKVRFFKSKFLNVSPPNAKTSLKKRSK